MIIRPRGAHYYALVAALLELAGRLIAINGAVAPGSLQRAADLGQIAAELDADAGDHRNHRQGDQRGHQRVFDRRGGGLAAGEAPNLFCHFGLLAAAPSARIPLTR